MGFNSGFKGLNISVLHCKLNNLEICLRRVNNSLMDFAAYCSVSACSYTFHNYFSKKGYRISATQLSRTGIMTGLFYFSRNGSRYLYCTSGVSHSVVLFSLSTDGSSYLGGPQETTPFKSPEDDGVCNSAVILCVVLLYSQSCYELRSKELFF